MLSPPGWTVLVIPLFCMPSAIPVTASTMNYASVVFAGFVAISFTWYLVWGKKNYHGPPAAKEEVQRRRSSIHVELPSS